MGRACRCQSAVVVRPEASRDELQDTGLGRVPVIGRVCTVVLDAEPRD